MEIIIKHLETVAQTLAPFFAPFEPFAAALTLAALAALAVVWAAAIIVRWFVRRGGEKRRLAQHQKVIAALDKFSLGFEEVQVSSLEKINALLERIQLALEERVRAAVAETLDLDGLQNKLSAVETQLKAGKEQTAAADAALSAFADKMGDKLDKSREESGVYLYDQLQNLRAAQSAAHDSLLVELRAPGDEELSATMKHSFAQLAKKVDDALSHSAAKTIGELNEKIRSLEQKIDGAIGKQLSASLGSFEQSLQNLQKHIGELSAAQNEIGKMGDEVAALSRVMIARVGGSPKTIDGQKLLSELLAQSLLPDLFQCDAVLENGQRVAALLNSPAADKIAINADISLAAFADIFDNETTAENRALARQSFDEEIMRQVAVTADNFINPPHTANSALLFIPSEAAFAEVQAHHPQAVSLAVARSVWLVSPTTLLAVISTTRLAMRDYQARMQLENIRQSLAEVVNEAQTFELRMVEIGDHVNSAWRSVQRAESVGQRLLGKVRGLSESAESESATSEKRAPVENT